jgi:hypothetical protein
VPFQDGKIVLDGHPAGIDIQPGQEVRDADGTVELKLFAVQGNVQGRYVAGCRADPRCSVPIRNQPSQGKLLTCIDLRLR